ncbi:hypothetical protein LINPERPRIM_LOCUS28673, partial [Linum perenne]
DSVPNFKVWTQILSPLSFTAKLGKCSITRAELRGIIQGFELAWNGGHRKIIVQTDSLAAVLLLVLTMPLLTNTRVKLLLSKIGWNVIGRL